MKDKFYSRRASSADISDVYPNSPSFFDKSKGCRGLTVMHMIWFGSLKVKLA
jgi:hypothetical protein